MKFRSLWLLTFLLFGAAAGAQQLINCDTNTPCGPQGPSLTNRGDPASVFGYKVNINFQSLYNFLYAPIQGPVSIAPGTNLSVIGNSVLTNAMLAPMPAQTVKCNPFPNDGLQPLDCSVSQLNSLLGVGGITSIGMTLPSWLTVNSPLVSNGTFAVTPTLGLNAHMVLLTPTSGTGPLAPRLLDPTDLPSPSGDVSISNGVASINPGAVSNTKSATMAGTTIKCNPSTSVGSPQDCSAATINAILGTSGGSGSGLTNQLDACSQTGIDKTGATDSRAAFVGLLATVAGTSTELEVNCPIKLAIGVDPTKSIFVRSGTNLRFGPAGMLIVDNNTIPAFVWDCASNMTWVSPHLQYVASLAIDDTVAPYGGIAKSFNDNQVKADMAANCGNTFGVNGASWWSFVNNSIGIFDIYGNSSNLTFVDPKFDVPVATAATSFIPAAVDMNIQYLPNTLITGGTGTVPGTSTYAALAQNVNFVRPVVDGYYSGFVGGAQVNIQGARFYRYSDLQDSGGGTQGGVGQWLTAPHAFFLMNGDSSLGAQFSIFDTVDYGIYVGGATRRAVGNGTLASISSQLDDGMQIDGYTSFRPDGFMTVTKPQVSPIGARGGSMRNVYAVFNSQTQGSDSGFVWGWKFQATQGLNQVNVQNVTLIDQATAPTSWPFLGPISANNVDVSMTGIKVYVQDIPAAATYLAGPGFGGTNVNIEVEDHLAVHSQTATGNGVARSGGFVCNYCTIDAKVFGWREPPITFTGGLSLGATTATLAATWPYATGTYSILFSDGEKVFTTFTNGSTTIGAFTALAGAVTANATGGGMLANNFNYKPVINLAVGNGSVGSRAHVIDYSNGYEAFADSGQLVESWTQSWAGTPAGTTSTGYATPISYPNTFAIDRYSYNVTSTLANTGLTGVNVGWTGNTVALFSNAALASGTNPAHPPATVTLPNNPTIVTLYPIGASFATGTVQVSARATQISASK